MQRICLFPGTFDPVTLGHVDIINRAIPLFDKIYVGIGINSSKSPMFSAEQRMEWFHVKTRRLDRRGCLRLGIHEVAADVLLGVENRLYP